MGASPEGHGVGKRKKLKLGEYQMLLPLTIRAPPWHPKMLDVKGGFLLSRRRAQNRKELVHKRIPEAACRGRVPDGVK